MTTDATKPLSDREREWVFRLLYAHEVGKRSLTALPALVDAYFKMGDAEWDELSAISPYVEDPRAGQVSESVWERVKGPVSRALLAIQAHLDDVLAAIREASPRWRIDRMPIIDRLLLVIGTYELLVSKARPAKRVINRTVELAKSYGEADSRRFVTGILDQVRKNHAIEAR